MEVIKTGIEGVVVIEPRIFKDETMMDLQTHFTSLVFVSMTC